MPFVPVLSITTISETLLLVFTQLEAFLALNALVFVPVVDPALVAAVLAAAACLIAVVEEFVVCTVIVVVDFTVSLIIELVVVVAGLANEVKVVQNLAGAPCIGICV